MSGGLATSYDAGPLRISAGHTAREGNSEFPTACSPERAPCLAARLISLDWGDASEHDFPGDACSPYRQPFATARVRGYLPCTLQQVRM